jgi:hypothetical protein
MTPRQARALGRSLRDLLASAPARRLGKRWSSWHAGGCWTLAEALIAWAGPAAVKAAVEEEGILQHAVVRIGDWYFDDQGAATREETKRRWVAVRIAEGLSEDVEVTGWDESGHEEMAGEAHWVCPARKVSALARLLRQRLGDPARWGIPRENPAGWRDGHARGTLCHTEPSPHGGSTMRRSTRRVPRHNPSRLKGIAEFDRKFKGDMIRHGRFPAGHPRARQLNSFGLLFKDYLNKRIGIDRLSEKLQQMASYHRARGSKKIAAVAADLAELALKVREGRCDKKAAKAAVRAGRKMLAQSHGKQVLSRQTARDRRAAKKGVKHPKRAKRTMPKRGAGGKFVKRSR